MTEMDRTEIAHWRYRVKAIEQDLQEARSRQSNLQNYAIYVVDGELKEWLEEAFRVSDAEIELTRWLLEEARYKSELGSIYEAAR